MGYQIIFKFSDFRFEDGVDLRFPEMKSHMNITWIRVYWSLTFFARSRSCASKFSVPGLFRLCAPEGL